MAESTTQYATTTHLTQMSVPAAALTGISSTVQDNALRAASRVADSYLVRRFQLPLTQWGDDLRQTVADIAAYRLLKQRGFNPNSADDVGLRQSYEDAVRWLEGVSKGTATPMDVVDSSSTALDDTDAAGEAAEAAAPLVLQPRNETTSEDEFWQEGGVVSTMGTGTPRRRGW